jgi:hypothetical protein
MSRNLKVFQIAICTAFILLCRQPASAQQPQQAPATEVAHHHGNDSHDGKVLLLPRELELRLAINALPPSLREEATVFALDPNGYVKVKQGSNPFTCMVSRRGGSLYPVCFDEEGTRTIMPAYIDDAVLRLKGTPAEEVDRQMAAGFESGRYRPPSRPGIAYMLSPATYLRDSSGKLARSIPHVMFYAPYLTDRDIGGVIGKSAFVDRPGPHGMIIVAAGQAERERALTNSQALIDELEHQIGLK